MLTLADVEKNPSLLTIEVKLPSGEELVFRPLMEGDVQALAGFLSGLSEETRRLSTFEGYDLAAAEELCGAIGKYDKLRFVIENSDGMIAGIIEFSFGIPDGDVRRFREMGVELNQETDCRFGPTLADDYQGKGLGSAVFPLVLEVARRFGKKRIILWGGVLKDNLRATRYYEKHGFRQVGVYAGEDGVERVDMILKTP